MKKLLALILAIVTVVALLVSCNQDAGGKNSDNQTTAAENTVDIDITKYTIIRAEIVSETLLSSVVNMKKEIDTLTGKSIKLSDDWLKKGVEPDDAAFEILIGATNRPQSGTVLGQIVGAAYSIALVGNKIVIIGTTDRATADGVEYFMSTYFRQAQKGIIKVEKDLLYTSEQYSIVELVSGGVCKYTVVYNDGLDNRAGSDEKDRYDYDVLMAMNVKDKIQSLTGATVMLGTDWAKAGEDTSSKYEILIGSTTRPETAAARAELGAAGWCVKITGNKIVVSGWSETTTELAVKSFISLLSQSVTTGTDGAKGISFLSNESVSGTYSDWITDIPEYDGGELSGCVDANFGQLEYYITGTSATEFSAYCTKLESLGYKQYFKNEIGGNLFATYTGNGNIIHTYFVAYQNAVRIITGAEKGSVSLPNVTEESYTKITDSAITQMTLDYASGNFGMCYVITLEDGSFIIFDGGGSSGEKDHIRLYNLLNTLNKRQDGKIVIAAWILTHEHWDHFMVFYNFCAAYGKTVKIEQYIANTPTNVVSYNSNNPNNYLESGQFSSASAAAGGIKLVKPHTGQVIKIRNASFEVLFTQEDIYPKKLHFFNDSTMVTRMSIAGQTFMWLGDTCDVASDIICKTFGNYLKSDMVQVAHHGYNGATLKFYQLIAPQFAFWPTSAGEFKNLTTGTGTAWWQIVDRYIVNELGLKEIYCASPDNISITLPYVAGSNKAVKIEVAAN